MKTAVVLLIIAFVFSFVLICPAEESLEQSVEQLAQYKDGIYEGQHSFIKVSVSIMGGKITGIEILKHGGGGEKYAQMLTPLLGQIIESQSVEIDAVSGATVSSENLKQAVNDALEKASIKSGCIAE